MICADELPAGGRARRSARALAAAGHLVTVHGVLADGFEPEEDDGDVVLVRVPMERWEPPRAGFRGMLAAGGYFERAAPLVKFALARDPPEAVHAFGLDVAGPALTAARGAGLPFVFDDAGGGTLGPSDAQESSPAGGLGDALRRLRASGDEVERRVRRAASLCIATSDSLADDAESRCGGTSPVVVRDCPPWRDVPKTGALRLRLGLDPADRLVVFHGPPDAAHGVETAIRALHVLGERVILALIGATWCQDRLLRIAAEEGVLPQVRVVSAQPGDDILWWIASAEVAVLPLSPADRATRLGLPPALLDVFLAGAPVVVPDVPEAGALVRRTGAGVVVPVGRSSPPAREDVDPVRALLADPRLAAACRRSAARSAREELRWDRESLRLVDAYDRLSSSR